MFVNLNNLLVNKNRPTLKAPNIELFDETLDINSTENYELSIQVSPEGLAFCLLDTIRNKYVLIRSFEPEENKLFNSEKLDELISKDDFLTKRYKKVNVVMPSKKFTLVPAPLFDPGKKDEYFTFNHLKNEDDIILTNKVTDPEAFIVYSASKSISTLINKYYPGVHPYHHIKPLFHHISHNRKSVSGNYIHIHIEKEFFNLIVFSDSQLSFCNTFNYRNISDILYFVMNVFKNLGIKQEETIHFSGKTEKYDDLSSNFSIYIRNIKFSEPFGNFTFSYVFNDMDLHRFLNLFNVINCES
ncbi:MAG TPA: DUF3822 family protein [Bacteroidales bacterium]